MSEYHLTTPFSEETIRKLRVGDTVYLSGQAFTCRSRLQRFVFDEGNPFYLEEHGCRQIKYASRDELKDAIREKYTPKPKTEPEATSAPEKEQKRMNTVPIEHEEKSDHSNVNAYAHMAQGATGDG